MYTITFHTLGKRKYIVNNWSKTARWWATAFLKNICYFLSSYCVNVTKGVTLISSSMKSFVSKMQYNRLSMQAVSGQMKMAYFSLPKKSYFSAKVREVWVLFVVLF